MGRYLSFHMGASGVGLGRMASGMVQSRAAFAEDLWLYGEDDLAAAMLSTDDDTHRRVMVAAGDPDVLEGDSRQCWSVSEMAALGAAQVLTGSPRYLARKRRRPERSLAEFWRAMGTARPDSNEGMVEAIILLDGGLGDGRE